MTFKDGNRIFLLLWRKRTDGDTNDEYDGDPARGYPGVYSGSTRHSNTRTMATRTSWATARKPTTRRNTRTRTVYVQLVRVMAHNLW